METKIKENVFRIIEKLRADKKTMLIIIIGVIGMLLVSFSELYDAAPDEDIKEEGIYSYENGQKEELEKIIGEISGVGRVRVMITYECSRESIFAYDSTEQTDEGSKKISTEHIIVDSGSDEEGLLLKEILPKALGVAVVCEGGGNPTVKNEITMLIKAIFAISSNNISISEMES